MVSRNNIFVWIVRVFMKIPGKIVVKANVLDVERTTRKLKLGSGGLPRGITRLGTSIYLSVAITQVTSP